MQIRNLSLALALACGGASLLTLDACADGIDTSKVNQSDIPVHVEKAFSNFQVERPVLIDNAGDGSNRLFIGSQYGKIVVLPNPQADEEPADFLDITDRVTYKDNENEEGLLGLAFHPKYRQNGEFFLYYTSNTEPHMSFISRFKVSKDNPNQADPKSEEVLMKIKQPYWNHNGGTLAFGPDGYLYIGMGDGGFRDDPLQAAQNLNTLLGKILRIDVDHKSPGLPYAIPADNPFIKKRDARGEIFAYGFRNIWRMSFDKPTGDFYVADVGQDLWEEIDLVESGGNYGWSAREGLHAGKSKLIDNTSKPTDPIWEYHHDIGKSITGGVVYHGSKVPELKGYYLYSDYVSGHQWALKIDPATHKVVENRTIKWSQNLPTVTYGTDESGEVYFSSTTGNGIYKFASGAK